MKEAEIVEWEKMGKLRDELEKHPLIVKLRQDQAAEILANRREIVAKIESLRKEEALTIPQLRAALQEKESIYQASKTALEAASTDCRKAAAALVNKSHMYCISIGNCEASLLETADPAIDTAICFFRDKFEELRKKRPTFDKAGSEPNIFTMKKTVTYRSNIVALENALRYCNRAITELEKMRLEPAANLEKIETLKTGIPDISEFQEYSAEKPLPPPPPDAYERIRSAEQAGTNDYLLRKLHEKADKLLRHR